ncbi:MAG TPA: sensor domain-containing diguanylate cyclase [Pseudomonadota bacterium]|nr:sensor domain-containing diguanylate cyclase [Pseudomonadota bacterium]
MRSKHSRLWLYNLALVAIVLALASRSWPLDSDWPSAPVVAGFFMLQLVVWQFGFPVPSMGMTSMERVPQIAAILLFPLPVAATMNALPALVWPFINHRYRQGSWHYGLVRAVHNACMLGLISAAAAWTYGALGGAVPLAGLDWADAFAVLLASLVMQLVNSAMMALFFHLDGRDVRRLLTWSYLTTDELFVPLGVLAALIYGQTDATTVLLSALFLVLTAVSLHALVESRQKVQTRVAALDAASGTRQALSGSRRVEEVAERLMSRIGVLFRYRTAFVAIHDSERGELDAVLEIVDGQRRPRRRYPVAQGLAGYVVREARAVLIDRWDAAPATLRRHAVIAADEQPGSILMVPILQGSDVLGVVSIQHAEANSYSDTDKNALLAIAEDLAPVIADARTFQELDEYRGRLEALVHERTAALEQAAEDRERLLVELRGKGRLLERQSREDALTGLANRRHFDERIGAEIERAQRYRHPLSLALIDLDHFKRINDGGGHALGDAVLVRIAAMLVEHFRASDLVARIGGEEFAVLFPETPVSGAVNSVELLRQRVAASDHADLAPWLRVSFSAGVSEWLPGEHRDALMRRSDARLYAAKHGGRDRVCGDPTP